MTAQIRQIPAAGGLELGEVHLPDPQLHRRLRESELQLLALVAQPPLGLRLDPFSHLPSRRQHHVSRSLTQPGQRPEAVRGRTPCQWSCQARVQGPGKVAR